MQTTQQKLEKRLFEHRKNKANIKLLESKVQKLELELYYHNQVAEIESELDVIEGVTVQAQVISDMPRGGTNRFNSVVENYLLRRKENALIKFDIKRIITDIENIYGAIQDMQKEVQEIDEFIGALGDKQRFVIEKYYIAKIKDTCEVAIMYNAEFKKPLGEERIRQIKLEALREMQEMLG